MDEKPETSVWYVAVIALSIFVGVSVATSLFTGNEVTAEAAQK